MKRLKAIVCTINWKDFDRRQYRHRDEIDKLLCKLVDAKKDRLCQRRMLTNIRKSMAKSGTILILAGVGHLDFLEHHLKDAEFPLRNK